MNTREYGTFVNFVTDPLNVNESFSIISLCTLGNIDLSVKSVVKGSTCSHC